MDTGKFRKPSRPSLDSSRCLVCPKVLLQLLTTRTSTPARWVCSGMERRYAPQTNELDSMPLNGSTQSAENEQAINQATRVSSAPATPRRITPASLGMQPQAPRSAPGNLSKSSVVASPLRARRLPNALPSIPQSCRTLDATDEEDSGRGQQEDEEVEDPALDEEDLLFLEEGGAEHFEDIDPEGLATRGQTAVRLIVPPVVSIVILRPKSKVVNVPGTVYFTQRIIPATTRRHFHLRQHDFNLALLPKSNPSTRLYFKLGEGAVPFRTVLLTFQLSGFQQTDDDRWNVLWAKRVSSETFESIHEFQRVNHFPGTWGIGRKDLLARNLYRMRRKFGEEAYCFFPPTYVLPEDSKALAADWGSFGRKPTVIVKPVASACGRGIKLMNRLPRTPTKPGRTILVQRYIGNPLLIYGYKFDLRLYVVCTSFDPLRVYLFSEGLVRFASEPYPGPKRGLRNRYMHLTNYSVNRTNTAHYVHRGSSSTPSIAPSSAPSGDHGGAGGTPAGASKWSLAELVRWFQEQADPDLPEWGEIWRTIQECVVKTLVSVEPQVVPQCHRLLTTGTGSHSNSCFELFGFDVLLDEDCRPYVLEVNIMPSLCSSSPLDQAVKAQLISHMLTLVGVVPFDRSRWRDKVGAAALLRLASRPAVPASSVPPPSSAHSNSSSTSTSNPANTSGTANCGSARQQVQMRLAEGAPLEAVAHLLGEDDWDVILYAEAELARCGNFRRLLPTSGGMELYGRFFLPQPPRFANLLLNAWERFKLSNPRWLEEAKRLTSEGSATAANLQATPPEPNH
eukprot:TRINITY_DN40498_c0_g1_i1.p1 TRINITY_DN40498_c0_g1~~TRINITY_DN40498_c0_g1_i1.p1  ORF type:complete len:801 (-),score=75.10 TRINITY_DN40498_c0_g1_i1:22-2397(-)